MEWELTEKEIIEAEDIAIENYLNEFGSGDDGGIATSGRVGIAQAQAKKLVEWLERFIVFKGNGRFEFEIRDKYWDELRRQVGLE